MGEGEVKGEVKVRVCVGRCTVVGGEHDHRVLVGPRPLQLRDDRANGVVQLRYVPWGE